MVSPPREPGCAFHAAQRSERRLPHRAPRVCSARYARTNSSPRIVPERASSDALDEASGSPLAAAMSYGPIGWSLPHRTRTTSQPAARSRRSLRGRRSRVGRRARGRAARWCRTRSRRAARGRRCRATPPGGRWNGRATRTAFMPRSTSSRLGQPALQLRLGRRRRSGRPAADERLPDGTGRHPRSACRQTGQRRPPRMRSTSPRTRMAVPRTATNDVPAVPFSCRDGDARARAPPCVTSCSRVRGSRSSRRHR